MVCSGRECPLRRRRDDIDGDSNSRALSRGGLWNVKMRSRFECVFVGVVMLSLSFVYFMAARAETFTVLGRQVLTLTDDAYISMRYARHLVDGHGLVWNVGEAPIEGFTNFLWVLWISVLTKLFGDPAYAM